ncbi:DsrE family protein [Citreimonas sp.]|uniref:DsrE family protein n=1 Tax=Citreimonas sp. TaxID=3036715 RepID=UPI0035C7F735
MTRLLTLIAAAFLLLAGPLAAQDDSYGQQKAVYHINFDGMSGTSYRSAMGNVQNHINAVGAENIEIAVVMHGDGLGLLMAANDDDGLQTRIGGLKSQNVRFLICANTLEGRDIALDDLYDAWDEDVVPSGVAELSKLQQDGYTYIKP